MNTKKKTAPVITPELLGVSDVAAMLGCSARHVWRLSDAGKTPRPVRLGGLVKWQRAAIMQWIDDGCPEADTPAPKVNGKKATLLFEEEE